MSQIASSTDSRTAAEFLELAVRSRVLTAERVKAVTAKLRRNTSAADVAQQLILDGELTGFQAKKLLGGLWQGLVIGRFRILKPIGRGGMGVVYLAEDSAATGKKVKVALKILPPRKAAAEPRTRARFLREVAMGRELPRATNIAHVYETGIVDGVAFIAMEFVPGRTLRGVVGTQGPLPLAAAARIFAGVAQALAASHEKNFIHRDVKPSNVMIVPDGTAKLVDFGFALRVGEVVTDPSVVGGAGYALGTFDFIPPEQVANAAAVTPAADQYSLGCTLYYALTGQPPFPGGDAKEKMQKHRWEDPLPLSTFRPELPAAFTAIVAKLMAKSPDHRFASCFAVARALEPYSKPLAEAKKNLFEDDTLEDVDDDLDQLAPFSPAQSRRSVYRRQQSPAGLAATLAVLLLAVVIAAVAIFARP